MKGSDLHPEILRPFDPRHVPLPAPAPDICDAPTVTICVNAEWWSHLDGMISRLLYRDAWQGTNDEIDRAIESIQEILAVGKADPMGCCCGNSGALTRYNENGELEISTDGGVTWNPYPQGDPRFTGRIAPPIPGEDGDDKKCAAAASAEEFVKQNFIDDLETGQTYATITDAAAALIALLGVTGIGLLILALVAAIFTAGIAAVQAAFTSEVWTDFRCILYCHISPDGSFTKAGWEGVKADILDTFTGVVSAVLYNWVNSVGPVGLTNSARSGFVATADCESCDCEDVWCYLFDFATAGTEDWEAIALGAGEFGQYVSGQYWDTTDAVDTIANPDQGERMAFIKRLFSARTITRVKVIYDYVKGVTDSATAPAIQIFLKDNSVWSRTFGAAADGNDQVAEWTGATAGIDEIRFHIRSSRDTTIPYAYSGTAHVKSILVEGMGSNPFGLDNCPEEWEE